MNMIYFLVALMVLTPILIPIYQKIVAKHRQESKAAGLWFIKSMEASTTLFEEKAKKLVDSITADTTLAEEQSVITQIFRELDALADYRKHFPADDFELIQDFGGLDAKAALTSLAAIKNRLTICRQVMEKCLQDRAFAHSQNTRW